MYANDEMVCLNCGGQLIKIDEISYNLPNANFRINPERYICAVCHTYHKKDENGKIVIDEFREEEHQEYLRMVEDH